MSQSQPQAPSSRPSRRTTKQLFWLRPGVQAFFFILVALISINHSLAESSKGIPFLSSASLHALCPFGGVVTAYQFLTTGTFVQKVHQASFILMVVGFLLAILAGPLFCGWVCPLGSFQELLGGIGRKLSKKRYNHIVPVKLDKVLRYFRYVVLVGVVVMTALSMQLVFSEFDPYFTLFNLWSDELAIGGVVVLGLVVLSSLFVERPFCKYACPYGALQGIFNKLRIFKLRRNESTCINCKACDRACPMNIQVSTATVVSDHQCIACFKCTSEGACPVPATVEFSTRRPK